MAGKIALGLVLALFLGIVCYEAGWYRREDRAEEFEIVSIVHELPEGYVTTNGVKPPYTVVARGHKAETHILPGILGLKGEAVTIHKTH